MVTEKSRVLNNNFRQIKPTATHRVKRWDQLGTVWKWLAGSPDAEDLRVINRTINNLITENNNQVTINRMINKRIEEITKSINELITQHSLENKILLQEFDALTILLYIENMNAMIEEFQDTILKARFSLPSNKLLTLKEVLLIESLLHEQGISTDFPEQALDYVVPKIATKENLLLYILQIPELQNGLSELVQIFPLVVNNTIIIDVPKVVVKSKGKVFTTTATNEFIQRQSKLEELDDNCTSKIITGSASYCNVIAENRSFIKLISSNKILINNANQAILFTDCGPHNRTLTGNFLLTFLNCTVVLNKETFTNKEITSEAEDLQGAFHNLKIERGITPHNDISLINNSTIENRNKLEHISLKQYHHQMWIFSILGGLSITSISIIAIATYACVRRRKVVINIRHPKTRLQKKTNVIFESSKKRTNKAEDDLSSPPGGVTMSPDSKTPFECTKGAL